MAVPETNNKQADLALQAAKTLLENIYFLIETKEIEVAPGLKDEISEWLKNWHQEGR